MRFFGLVRERSEELEPPPAHKLRQRTAPHAFPVMRFLGTALQFCSLTVVAYAG